MSRKSQETSGPNIFPLRRDLTPFNVRDCFSHRSVLRRGIFSRKRMIRRCRSIPTSNRFVHAFLA